MDCFEPGELLRINPVGADGSRSTVHCYNPVDTTFAGILRNGSTVMFLAPHKFSDWGKECWWTLVLSSLGVIAVHVNDVVRCAGDER
jgi:hypothetical protein